MKRFVVNKYQR